MEHRNIPICTGRVQELEQSTGSFRELEAENALVCRQFRVAAYHVAKVRFSEFIFRDIQCGKALVFKQFLDFGGFASMFGLDTDKDLGIGGVRNTIVELSDVAAAKQRNQRAERIFLFRDCDGKEDFAVFAEFGSFCHEAQTIEVHIGAGKNADEGLILAAVLLDVVFNTCDGESTGRFKNASRILEYVLDRGTDLVRVYQHNAVNEILAKLIGLFADELDRRTVGEEADIRHQGSFSVFKGLIHAVRIVRLDAENLDIRVERFNVNSDAGEQSAASDGDEDRINIAVGVLSLANNFHAHGALSGDDIRIIERRYGR